MVGVIGGNKIDGVIAHIVVTCAIIGIVPQQMVEFYGFINSKGAGAGHLAKDDCAGTIGGDTEEDGLVAVEGHTCRTYRIGKVPAVGIATPAEIEMEITILRVSVADKGVAT